MASRVNSEKLFKVMVHVRKHPENFDMDTYGQNPNGEGADPTQTEKIDTACNTTACIAGWTAIIFDSPHKWVKEFTYNDKPYFELKSAIPDSHIETDAANILEVHGFEDTYKLFRASGDVWEDVDELSDGEVTLEKVDAWIAAHPDKQFDVTLKGMIATKITVTAEDATEALKVALEIAMPNVDDLVMLLDSVVIEPHEDTDEKAKES